MGLFSGTRPNRSDTFSATGGASITKADSDISYTAETSLGGVSPPSKFPRGFMQSDAGSVKLTLHDGSVLTFASGELALGVIHPFSVVRVWSTGSSATVFKVFW